MGRMTALALLLSPSRMSNIKEHVYESIGIVSRGISNIVAVLFLLRSLYFSFEVPEGPEPVDCFDDSGSRIKSGSNAW